MTRIEELRRELDRLNRRNVTPEAETEVRQDDLRLTPPATESERREHQAYIAEGGTLALCDWAYVDRAFRAYLGR